MHVDIENPGDVPENLTELAAEHAGEAAAIVETETPEPAAEPTPEERKAAEEAAMNEVFDKAEGKEKPAADEVDEVEAAAVADAAKPKPEEPVAKTREEMTDEERDEDDAKQLGFKNQKANTEFKRMRKELREYEPVIKDYEERAKPNAERWEHLMNYVEKSNIPSDVFGNGMAMLAGICSTDLDVMRKTRDGLMMEARKLSAKLGEGDDALQQHQDLHAAVQNGEMTPEQAATFARERAERDHYRNLHQQQTTQAQQQATQRAEQQRAIADLDALQAEYEKIDPHFRAKAEIAIEVVKAANLPPSAWLATFKAAYAAAPAPAQAAPAPAKVAPLRNQPLRAGTAPASSTMGAALKTPEDVMEAAMRDAAAANGVAYGG